MRGGSRVHMRAAQGREDIPRADIWLEREPRLQNSALGGHNYQRLLLLLDMVNRWITGAPYAPILYPSSCGYFCPLYRLCEPKLVQFSAPKDFRSNRVLWHLVWELASSDQIDRTKCEFHDRCIRMWRLVSSNMRRCGSYLNAEESIHCKGATRQILPPIHGHRERHRRQFSRRLSK